MQFKRFWPLHALFSFLFFISVFNSKARAFSPPDDKGTYLFTINKTKIDLGIRKVKASIYVPLDKDRQPFPVVVFMHSFASTGEAYINYGKHLASHGFFAIFPTIETHFFNTLTHVELAQMHIRLNDWIEHQAADENSLYYGVIDPDSIGAAGHSRGAKQAILTATMDSRIKALFGIDAVDAGPPFWSNPEAYPSATPERMNQFSIPSVFIGGGHSHEGTLGIPCAPLNDNFHEFFAHAESNSYEYKIVDAGHNDFLDECDMMCRMMCKQGSNKEFTRAFSRSTLVAFFKLFLKKDERFKEWLHEKIQVYDDKVQISVK